MISQMDIWIWENLESNSESPTIAALMSSRFMNIIPNRYCSRCKNEKCDATKSVTFYILTTETDMLDLRGLKGKYGVFGLYMNPNMYKIIHLAYLYSFWTTLGQDNNQRSSYSTIWEYEKRRCIHTSKWLSGSIYLDMTTD